MSDLSLIHGAGGGGDKPKEPTNTPDNLFSEDVVEFALAVSEGPIRGLVNGAKSFYVGDTPLVSETGYKNFDKFAIGVYPGYPDGSAIPVALQLGGQTSNFQVGVNLLQNVEVIRQTSPTLRGQIDELEVRINFQRLMVNNSDGSFNNTAKVQIQYKATAASTWLNFYNQGAPVSVVFTDLDPQGQRIVHYEVAEGAQVVKDQVIATIEYVLNGTESTGLGSTYYKFQQGTNKVRAPTAGYVHLSLSDGWTGTLDGSPVAQVTPISGEDGVLYITGKTSSGYAKDFRIPVPRLPDDDWMIRVVKLNPDNSTTAFAEMQWESFQATTKTPVAYPDVAIVHGLGVATGQFSSIPDFSGVYDGLIVRVPSNYNPDLRTYDESTPWDGTFKFAWTNNPAWILYDLIVNPRYGYAKHYPYIDANRFDFYLAAKWCDEQVPNSNGVGTSPRFTYNDVLSEPRQARDMLSYVAGAFNAICWDDLSGKIHLRVDRDDVASMMFTPENITKEGFNYSFTDISTRVNDISVVFVNPELDWNEDRRRYPGITTDENAIAKYGRIPEDFIAVGCTSLEEALRRAKIRLLTAQTETTTVTFTTTRLGSLLSLFDVILIADPVMGWSQSGRIKSYDDQYVYLRDPIFIETMETYVMKVQNVGEIIEVNVTPEQVGQVYRLALSTPLPAQLPGKAVFTLEQTGGFGFAKPFRVLSVTEVEGSPYTYAISALEINRNKYYEGDNLPSIGEFQYSYKQVVLPSEVQGAYAESGDAHLLILPTGEIITRIFVTWNPPLSGEVTNYEVEWRRVGQEDWQHMNVAGTSCYISPAEPNAEYEIRIRSVIA